MKKIIKVSGLLVFTLVFLSGCWGQKKVPNSDVNENEQANVNENTNQVVVAENEAVLKRFYPIITRVDASDVNQTGKPNDAERGFVITQELLVKLHLIDKFNPGICYGMPGPIPEEAISGMINNNPILAKFLKDKYVLTTDLDVYNKIKQINGIDLRKLAGGKYKFSFMDGQCCTLTGYAGNVNVVGNDITDEVTDQESKNNPC